MAWTTLVTKAVGASKGRADKRVHLTLAEGVQGVDPGFNVRMFLVAAGHEAGVGLRDAPVDEEDVAVDVSELRML